MENEKRKLSEKQVEILKQCNVKPRENKWLYENIVKSPGSLSSYLKKLQRIGFLERDSEERTYKTTDAGIKFLEESRIIDASDAAKSRALTQVPANLQSSLEGNKLPITIHTYP